MMCEKEATQADMSPLYTLLSLSLRMRGARPLVSCRCMDAASSAMGTRMERHGTNGIRNRRVLCHSWCSLQAGMSTKCVGATDTNASGEMRSIGMASRTHGRTHKQSAFTRAVVDCNVLCQQSLRRTGSQKLLGVVCEVVLRTRRHFMIYTDTHQSWFASVKDISFARQLKVLAVSPLLQDCTTPSLYFSVAGLFCVGRCLALFAQDTAHGKWSQKL